MEERTLTCIGCPLGCLITVKLENGEVKEITGNTCKRGEVYAGKEVTNPTRIVTSVCLVENGVYPVVSVKTASDIPKDKIFDLVESLKGKSVSAPVKIGDVILKDAAGTGVDVIATKNVEKA